MSDPVIFLRKWIGEVKRLQIRLRFFYFEFLVDVCRYFKHELGIVHLGSILHDQMEYSIH